MAGYLGALSDNIRVNADKCIFCGKCVDTCVLDNLRLKLAPCRQACPMEVNVQGYVRLILRGEEDKARELIREKLPFPEMVCLVCHHPCEAVCERGKTDAPVNIRGLKRYLFDCESGRSVSLPSRAPDSGKSIAIVGSGPAGLVAAYDLARQGHSVVVHEMNGLAGGQLAKGIPAFRLPEETVRRELSVLPHLGVEFAFHSRIGEDKTLTDLEQEHDAVILAAGLGQGRRLHTRGEELVGVQNGTDFLAAARAGSAPELPGNVIVIGGGNVAIDTALSALRQGASRVAVAALEQPAELPAFAQEVRQAQEEGVEFLCGWGPVRLNETAGRVTGLVLRRCLRVFDDQGRFAPVFDENVTQTLNADHVLISIGQMREPGVLNGSGLRLEDLASVDSLTKQWGSRKLFVAGDFLTGPGSVIGAMASGRAAAESAHRLVNGQHLRYGRNYPGPVETDFRVNTDRGADVPRQESPNHVCEGKGDYAVVEGSLKPEQARMEAGRCRSCGSVYGKYRSCCFCLPCEVECPEQALRVEIPYLLR
ncbi:FAD-dependent oxidoreductase [Desulfovibrio sp. SGI.169]|uniref:FAD-dependent oxidoreductase n=1 Tax=Desulfovibrio sp. SGI.169 TaxID=3420561 RepID=UPI003D06AE37